MLEHEMVVNSVNYLISNNYCTNIKYEVPFLSRCIDVVYIDKNDQIVSIEFKVKNWHHAIEQAKNHKLGADKSYICIPKRTVSDKMLNELEKANLGLYMYDSESNNVIEEIPAPSSVTNAAILKKMLINNFLKI